MYIHHGSDQFEIETSSHDNQLSVEIFRIRTGLLDSSKFSYYLDFSRVPCISFIIV